MNPLEFEMFFVFEAALKLFQKNKIAVQKGYMIIKIILIIINLTNRLEVLMHFKIISL